MGLRDFWKKVTGANNPDNLVDNTREEVDMENVGTSFVDPLFPEVVTDASESQISIEGKEPDSVFITDKTIGGLSVDELAVVHATSYMPEITENGELEISTTYDALGGINQDPHKFLFRNTIHTCLNGVVASHQSGQWDDKGIVIVTPFINAFENNGTPAGFDTVDTYWAFDENTPMRLTEWKIVQGAADGFEEDEFIRHEGSRVFYKNSFSENERLSLVRDFFVGVKKEELYNQSRGDFPSAEAVKIEAYGSICRDLQNRGADFKLFEGLYVEDSLGIEEFERRLLSASDEELGFIHSYFTFKLRGEAVHQAAEEYGCPRRLCGKDYWVGKEFMAEGQDEFAESIGSKHIKHFYSKEAELERMINGQDQMQCKTYRCDPAVVKGVIDQYREQLPESTIMVAEKIINSDVYRNAVEIRDKAFQCVDAPAPAEA